MSKCDVWFEFDRTTQHYQPGETISGLIHVRVNKDCRCNRIVLRMEWRTHGRGNIDSGGRQEFIYAENETFRAGEDHAIPFRVAAPYGPLSYHGELINIGWVLRASIDIPWALDPKVETDILISGADLPVVPFPELANELVVGQAAADAIRPGTKRTLLRAAVLVGLIALCVGMFFMVPEDLMYIPMILIAALVIRALVAMVWFRMKAKKMIGQTETLVIHEHLRPNGLLACDVRLAPPDPSLIEGVICTLRGRETAVSGSGTDETTSTHVFHEQCQRLPGPFTSDSLEEITASFAMRLPADAPSTFAQPSNKIAWELETVIQLKKWPDRKQRESLRVSADHLLGADDVEV